MNTHKEKIQTRYNGMGHVQIFTNSKLGLIAQKLFQFFALIFILTRLFSTNTAVAEDFQLPVKVLLEIAKETEAWAHNGYYPDSHPLGPGRGTCLHAAIENASQCLVRGATPRIVVTSWLEPTLPPNFDGNYNGIYGPHQQAAHAVVSVNNWGVMRRYLSWGRSFRSVNEVYENFNMMPGSKKHQGMGLVSFIRENTFYSKWYYEAEEPPTGRTFLSRVKLSAIRSLGIKQNLLNVGASVSQIFPIGARVLDEPVARSLSKETCGLSNFGVAAAGTTTSILGLKATIETVGSAQTAASLAARTSGLSLSALYALGVGAAFATTPTTPEGVRERIKSYGITENSNGTFDGWGYGGF